MLDHVAVVFFGKILNEDRVAIALFITLEILQEVLKKVKSLFKTQLIDGKPGPNFTLGAEYDV
ncbi:MAG: hypothetical protein H6560_24495 [Lewinellaceae bacterium]|nr:hypothetical protein [Lewinellaceae bacterium]